MAAYTLAQLAEHVGGYVVGDGSCHITHVATLKNADSGAISFLTNPKYVADLQHTNASAVILHEKSAANCPVPALVSVDPRVAYAKIATLLYSDARGGKRSGIHPTACVSDNVRIGAGVWIGPQCVIDDNVEIGAGSQIGPGCYLADHVHIGENCELVSNVTILNDCQVGDRALFSPGVVIGADGFGMANDHGKWVKVPQVGAVKIGNDVEIGANTTIDRGAIEDTTVGNGVKLDNQIQIGHNVQIGDDTCIAAACAIGGSTIIGKNCLFGGMVGVTGHLSIADGVMLTGRSMVAASIKEPGVYSSSTPLEPNKKWHRNYVRFKQLDEMAKRLIKLEKLVEQERGS
ncbi:MAG: UDP-3-O-(3-hydroxymyristoyl)glucosamine N-acyltransferase [Gammaproteobacteria bacterium]|nr:UDP-3-O-(3-hydroxymyristoyl)glucosamine N-acyltransferase [Gammaproteobacteria bacterium]MDH5652827.1 UDP-3-O-(3-hydroxymyristoyl)glucosamine N-acyltransferase [Gammaproteobacteria bacterium]